jgi:hypothetical protein
MKDPVAQDQMGRPDESVAAISRNDASEHSIECAPHRATGRDSSPVNSHPGLKLIVVNSGYYPALLLVAFVQQRGRYIGKTDDFHWTMQWVTHYCLLASC